MSTPDREPGRGRRIGLVLGPAVFAQLLALPAPRSPGTGTGGVAGGGRGGAGGGGRRRAVRRSRGVPVASEHKEEVTQLR